MSYLSNLRVFFAGIIVLALPFQPVASAEINAPAKEKILQGSVSHIELIDNLERLGIGVAARDGAKPALVVENVHMGTAAYYKGVAEGDGIISLVARNDHFDLTIERAGKVYQIPLKLANPMLDGRATTLTGGVQDKDNSQKLTASASQLDLAAKNQMLQGTTKSQNLEGQINDKQKEPEKKLIPYDIEVVIDISGSMQDEDGTGGISKFQWCHNQVRTLTEKLAPFHKKITVTTFNRNFETFEHCDPAKVEQIYASTEPKGGTDLRDPLMSRLNSALTKYADLKKRVLIAVITDGMPNIPRDPMVVNRAIVNYTHKLTDPNEVKVTFLQIGDTFEGKDFCLDLDDGLVGEGAKYDIVDTETFEELKRVGIVNALIDAILDKNSSHLANSDRNRHSSASASSQQAAQADKDLKAIQEERKQLEKQIFGN